MLLNILLPLIRSCAAIIVYNNYVTDAAFVFIIAAHDGGRGRGT